MIETPGGTISIREFYDEVAELEGQRVNFRAVLESIGQQHVIGIRWPLEILPRNLVNSYQDFQKELKEQIEIVENQIQMQGYPYAVRDLDVRIGGAERDLRNSVRSEFGLSGRFDIYEDTIDVAIKFYTESPEVLNESEIEALLNLPSIDIESIFGHPDGKFFITAAVRAVREDDPYISTVTVPLLPAYTGGREVNVDELIDPTLDQKERIRQYLDKYIEVDSLPKRVVDFPSEQAPRLVEALRANLL